AARRESERIPQPTRRPQPRAPPRAGAIPAAAQVSAGPRRHGGAPQKGAPVPHRLHPSAPSAGWIPDGSGKWVKDENAEFDSDEEEPPALLPA
ncbi:SCNM1 protein, partial [Piaya cayana]|nr:SCNM1 protein [Piaya cayana]